VARRLGAAKQVLLAKLASREAVVAVFGLGYVGLPFAVRVSQVGYRTIGIDSNPDRVLRLNKGESYISDVPSTQLRELVQSGVLGAVSSTDVLRSSDVVVLCVPTPLGRNLEPDLSAVSCVSEEVGRALRPGQLVVLESTTYPGTTEEVVLAALEKSGLQVGVDFFLAHSPERIDPGNLDSCAQHIVKVVGGVTPNCLEVATRFLREVVRETVPVSSARVAELSKVYENTYRAVNIALANELLLLCDEMGLDVWEVIGAAGTKPFGFQTFYPGPGVGGHCIPVDPFYLAWKAREYGFRTRFIELAGEINGYMPRYVVQRTLRLLNLHRKPAAGSRVLIVGVAYKKNVADVREAPALEIMERLTKLGACVEYYDPHVPYLQLASGRARKSTTLVGGVERADCIVIVTDHSAVDYSFLLASGKPILDTRNALAGFTDPKGRVQRL
jgi:UDP-N-acetyl-D-glucosamine dehydrogenase